MVFNRSDAFKLFRFNSEKIVIIHILKDNIDLQRFKNNILQDIKDHLFDIYSVGGGSFVQYFETKKIVN